MQSRRHFLKATTLTAVMAGLPLSAQDLGQGGNVYPTDAGDITVNPISHASFVLEVPGRVIYNDPVGDPELYSAFPAPDLILLTHHHGDHFNLETLQALVQEQTRLIVNPTVFDLLPPELQASATSMKNGDSATVGDISIEAIPAYNTTPERQEYHPEGRDNGYVLTIAGFRIYIAGDTEETEAMRNLRDIDLAFVPMNLPYTMDETAAAAAVSIFAPQFVYPYHYKGSDLSVFAKALTSATVMKLGKWYE